MTDILSINNSSDFFKAINRKPPVDDEFAYFLDFEKLKRVNEIIFKIASLTDGDLFGYSVIPSGCDATIKVRCGSLVIEGENIFTLTPIRRLLQDVEELSIEPVNGHFTIEFRISGLYTKTHEDDLF